MSTISTFLLIYNYYANVLGLDPNVVSNKSLFDVVAILAIIILVIGNITYFISAYFSYILFSEKKLERVGGKVIFHKIFNWIQFNVSMNKTDLGMIIFLLITTSIWDYQDYVLLIIDALVTIASFVLILFLHRALKNENTMNMIIIMVFKILSLGYRIFRVYMLMTSENVDKEFYDLEYNFGIVFVYLTSSFDLVFSVLIVITSVVNYKYFDKGFKEALETQRRNTKSLPLSHRERETDF